MIKVSEAYVEAVKKCNRIDRLTGTIKFSNGDEIKLSDEIIVNNSATLTEQICSGNTFEIGTFYTNQFSITIQDKDYLLHNYPNAKITPFYGLKLPDTTWENIPLGEFWVDNSYTKRKGTNHYLTAFDASVKFDKEITGLKLQGTVTEYIQSACAKCGVSLALTLEQLREFPNADEQVSIESSSIQTYRDLIEWCVMLMGCSAKIDRYGKFALVKLEEKGDEEGYIFETTISGDERFGTEFFDLRALTHYISTTINGESVVHTKSNWLDDEVGRNAIIFVPENPLLKGKTNAKEIFVNSLSNFSVALRNVEFGFIGNPAIECFDTVGVIGGQIDNNRRMAIFPTKLVWRYRNKHSVSCVSAEVTEESTIKKETAQPTTVDLLDEETELPLVPVRVKSQTEKRIDGLEYHVINNVGGVGKFANEEKNSEIFNDYTSNTAAGPMHHVEGAANRITGGTVNHAEGSGNEISGTFSHAENSGNKIINGASNAHAEGTGNTVTNSASNAHVEGTGNTVTDGAGNAHVEGIGNKTTGGAINHSEGYNNTVTGVQYTHAEGSGNTAEGGSCQHIEGQNNAVKNGSTVAHAEGSGNVITDGCSNCHAEGVGNNISSSAACCHAEGNTNVITYGSSGAASNVHIEGYGNTVRGGTANHAEGVGNEVTGKYSHAEGQRNTVTGSDTVHIEGISNSSDGGCSYCHIEGSGNSVKQGSCWHVSGHGNEVECKSGDSMGGTVSGQDNTVSGSFESVSGMSNSVSGTANAVSGSFNNVSGQQHIVGGSQNVCDGSYSLVAGLDNNVSADGSVVGGIHGTLSGEHNVLNGIYNTAENVKESIVTGSYNDLSEAENAAVHGGFNTVSGAADGSAVIGWQNKLTDASCTFVAGQYNEVSGSRSFVAGDHNISSHENTAVFGQFNEDTDAAFAVGTGSYDDRKNGMELGRADNFAAGNRCKAIGGASMAFGLENTAPGDASFAAGAYNCAKRPYTSALGKYNQPKDMALVIGGGTDDENRANIMELYWNGDLEVMGRLKNLTPLKNTELQSLIAIAGG